MGRASRTKGAAGEREFFSRLRVLDPSAGMHRALNSTRDGGSDGLYRGIQLEIKRHRVLALTSWYHQATAQSEGACAAVAFRLDRQEWQVMPIMSVEEFADWARWRERRDNIDKIVEEMEGGDDE